MQQALVADMIVPTPEAEWTRIGRGRRSNKMGFSHGRVCRDPCCRPELAEENLFEEHGPVDLEAHSLWGAYTPTSTPPKRHMPSTPSSAKTVVPSDVSTIEPPSVSGCTPMADLFKTYRTKVELQKDIHVPKVPLSFYGSSWEPLRSTSTITSSSLPNISEDKASHTHGFHHTNEIGVQTSNVFDAEVLGKAIQISNANVDDRLKEIERVLEDDPKHNDLELEPVIDEACCQEVARKCQSHFARDSVAKSGYGNRRRRRNGLEDVYVSADGMAAIASSGAGTEGWATTTPARQCEVDASLLSG